jgi:hypothetical protein
VATQDLRGVSSREKRHLPGPALRRPRDAEAGVEGKGSSGEAEGSEVCERGEESAQGSRKDGKLGPEEGVDLGIRLADPDAVEKNDEDPRNRGFPRNGGWEGIGQERSVTLRRGGRA